MLLISALVLTALASRAERRQSPVQGHHLVGAHPVFRLMMNQKLRETMEEGDKLATKTRETHIVNLLTTPESQNSRGDGSGEPYFPFAPERGYIDIYDENNSMWYWHFRAKENPDTAPLMIWLQGGPGGASTDDVFFSNGPYSFHDWPKGSKRATYRNTSWVNKINMIYPDFPLGVGFSTVTGDKLSRVYDQAQQQILIFFEKFIENRPEYKGRPLYIGGVSYGGHWVPITATALKNSGNPDINVKGFYISDGVIDPEVMDQSYLTFGLKNSKYTKFTQETIKKFTPLLDVCLFSQKRGHNPMHARNSLNLCWWTYYDQIRVYSLNKNPSWDPYFMPGPSKSPANLKDLSFMLFLNSPEAQRYLGVRKHSYLPINMTFFNDYSKANFYVDRKPMIARLLDDGLKGVITVGDLDFITNYEMSEKVTSELKWEHQKEFNAAPRAPCKYGLCKEYKNLREIRVFGSGHGISQYKPEHALEIVNALVGERASNYQ